MNIAKVNINYLLVGVYSTNCWGKASTFWQERMLLCPRLKGGVYYDLFTLT